MRFRPSTSSRAAAVATVAMLAGGLAFAAPANAAALPTVTVEDGIVTITGTDARDVINTNIGITELAIDFGSDGTVDATVPRSQFHQMRVLGGAGNDGMSASRTRGVPVTISGGPGNDFVGVLGGAETGPGDPPITLSGGDGNDRFLAVTPAPVTILAGAGDDSVDGGGFGVGPETVSLGDGDDRFRSELYVPFGPHYDEVDGGNGNDTIDVEGTFASENIGFLARNGRLVVNHELRDQIFATNVEDVSYLGFGGLDETGGGDAVGVNDLSGTGVLRFTADFRAQHGSNEHNNSADTFSVRGTPGVDHITVSGSKGNVLVSGLTPVVRALFLHPHDFLRIETLQGDDTVDTSGLEPGQVTLRIV